MGSKYPIESARWDTKVKGARKKRTTITFFRRAIEEQIKEAYKKELKIVKLMAEGEVAVAKRRRSRMSFSTVQRLQRFGVSSAGL